MSDAQVVDDKALQNHQAPGAVCNRVVHLKADALSRIQHPEQEVPPAGDVQRPADLSRVLLHEGPLLGLIEVVPEEALPQHRL